MQIIENNAKACISMQRCNMKVAAFHNSREGFIPETSRPELAKKNRCSCSALAALQKIKDWDAKADENYAKTHGGRKSPVKEQNKVWEAVINLNSRHTMADVKKLTKKLEKITGYKAAQVAIHKDEGHINDDGDFVRNIHAHVIFYARDPKTGLSLSTANFGRKDLMRKMQDAVAEELGMERGRPAEETGRKHLSPRAYKAQKRQEAALEKNNAEWQAKMAEKQKEWEAKQAEREARQAEWERKLPEIMEARRRNEQFLNGRVDWETLKTANKAFLLWHDISTDILGYPNPNGNLLIEQSKGALASVFRLFGTVSQLAIFMLTRTEARELKLKNTMDIYKVSENLQRAVNLVANDVSNDHRKIAEKIQSVFTNLPHDKRQELIELAILHAPNAEIKADIQALVEGRFSHIARTEAAQKRIENRDLRAELREYSEEIKRIKEELREMDEENRVLNLAEREILKSKGAGRDEYAEQEAENKARQEEMQKLKDEAKKLKKDLEEARKQQEVDKNTLKEQAAQIKELTARIAKISAENIAKQKELEDAKEETRQTAPQTPPKDAFDIFDIIDEQKPEKPEPEPREEPKIEPVKIEPEPKIEPKPEKIEPIREEPKPEPVKPEPEQKPAKDDFTNIYGYPRPQIEPRRRLDDYEPRKTYDDRPKYEPEPIREPVKTEPEREEPIFRDPWTEIEETMKRWKKTDNEVEKNLLKNNIFEIIEKYEKNGVPAHRQMSLDGFRRALLPNLAADAEEIRKIREQELERKRQQAEMAIKYEEVKTKSVKQQEDDTRQTALKKKKKEDYEMGR